MTNPGSSKRVMAIERGREPQEFNSVKAAAKAYGLRFGCEVTTAIETGRSPNGKVWFDYALD